MSTTPPVDSANPLALRSDVLSRCTELSSQSGMIEILLEWDFVRGTPQVDLDTSCVIFNEIGSLVDAVYYNQLSALDNAVVHSGDVKATATGTVKEVIRIDLDRLSNVSVLVFVLSAYEGGTLADCESASVNFNQGSNLLCSLVVGGPEIGKGTSLILGIPCNSV